MLSEKIPHLLNACIVAAHPDDEVLWFSSVVTRVEKVFICFMGNPNRPGLGRGRRAALEQPPNKWGQTRYSPLPSRQRRLFTRANSELIGN